MDNLFKELDSGDMILAVKGFALKGKAKYVFAMLNLLATTEPIENDFFWWSCRADIISKDQDKRDCLDVKLRLN